MWRNRPNSSLQFLCASFYLPEPYCIRHDIFTHDRGWCMSRCETWLTHNDLNGFILDWILLYVLPSLDDDCFYCYFWRNNIVIAFGTLSSIFRCFEFIFSYTLKPHSYLDPQACTILDVADEKNEQDILFGHLVGYFLVQKRLPWDWWITNPLIHCDRQNRQTNIQICLKVNAKKKLIRRLTRPMRPDRT